MSDLRLTKALFFESSDTSLRSKYPPKYTLKLQDYQPEGYDKPLPSAYRIYMECVDEYEAAMVLLGNLEHWNRLCSLPWFLKGGMQPADSHIGLEVWREHMAARDASLAKKLLIQAAEEGNVSAQRKLYDMSSTGHKASSKKPELKKVDSKVSTLLSRMENK